MMARSSNHAPKKVSTLKKPRKRRNTKKRRKLSLNPSAN